MGWDLIIQWWGYRVLNFNPPIPCGMGLKDWDPQLYALLISIHPSRVGWDDEWELDEIAWE